MIEAIFVLFILMMTTQITIHRLPDLSIFKYHYLRELLLKHQFEAIQNHKEIEIELYESTIYIDNKEFDLSPLICEHEIFHYNEEGNISQALTLHCSFKRNYEYRLQLGTGWISYE